MGFIDKCLGGCRHARSENLHWNTKKQKQLETETVGEGGGVVSQLGGVCLYPPRGKGYTDITISTHSNSLSGVIHQCDEWTYLATAHILFKPSGSGILSFTKLSSLVFTHNHLLRFVFLWCIALLCRTALLYQTQELSTLKKEEKKRE